MFKKIGASYERSSSAANTGGCGRVDIKSFGRNFITTVYSETEFSYYDPTEGGLNAFDPLVASSLSFKLHGLNLYRIHAGQSPVNVLIKDHWLMIPNCRSLLFFQLTDLSLEHIII